MKPSLSLFICSLALALAAPVRAAEPVDVKRLHVLMINGGGTRESNFRSHLSHLKQLVALLDRSHVSRDRVSVLAGDGSNPAADLAVLDTQPDEALWLLDRTPLQELLAPKLQYINSELAGLELAPATQASLTQWFRGARKRLTPGDTLLVFVTDHGENRTQDPWQSQITLWGPRESISVRQVRALLETLHPKVRVVTVMSQCFSGGFAKLYQTHSGNSALVGNTCGFFSSTADRPAYGCFPENQGQDSVGHAFRFFEALAQGHDFARAHRETMINDDSPDVPLRTSDVFLIDQLQAYALKQKVDVSAAIDKLLSEAWKNKGKWESDIRLLDALGRAYGLFSPRTLKELDGPEKQLSAVLEQLDRHGRLWEDALSDITNSNLREFLAQAPQWSAKLNPHRIHRLEEASRQQLAGTLLVELVAFTEAQAQRRERLERVATRLDTVSEVAYRMQVRLAAILRMRTLLARVAGQVLIEVEATPARRQSLAALETCEAMALPPGRGAPVAVKETPSLPSYEEDLKQAQAVFPAWLGIEFRAVPSSLVARHQLPPGASMIGRVFPNSPAQRAGLRAGDVLVGPPETPFEDNNQVRTWTMLSPTQTPLGMQVVRAGQRMLMNITLSPYPSDLPKLPTRPDEGEKAPSLLSLESYRGTKPEKLMAKGPYLLFFWATWCGPCKASVAELMRFAEHRKIPLLAVTDEDRGTLDAFFAQHKVPFPANVAVDESRMSFITYGISATPTFVLVDESGNISSYTRGYDVSSGLPFPGWVRPRR